MNEKRIPSFNDFSPGILNEDIRPCLRAIVDANGNDHVAVAAWAQRYFGGASNIRSSTNIPATLRSTGLTAGKRPMVLTPIGIDVLNAPTAVEAALLFCTHILKNKNGDAVLTALRNLQARHIKVTKATLQDELARIGIVGLSTATTDHTTLKNWLKFCGLISADETPNENKVKACLGLTVEEADTLSSLPLAQQVYLQELRRRHITEIGPFAAESLNKHCLSLYPELFDPAQLAKKVRDPLAKAGWIEVSGLASGKQGGKSGYIKGSSKLLGIPAERFIPDFDAAVPPELRSKLLTPPSEILTDLRSTDTYKGGLALELLSLRMVMDLGLDPRHFRLRSAQSAHAEVDLIAEAAHLMFSRWTVQCKRYAHGTNVQLADVAKEVGIAIFAKAHVVMVVTTSDFTSSARKYANEVTISQPIQFLFVPGSVVEDYLKSGRDALITHVRDNARQVMSLKRGQPLPKDESN